MWFVFALHDLTVFMVYWTITYSEPFQTSKMELFVKKVTSKETNPLLGCFRSSHRRCSVKTGALRNFAKLTGKDLCQSLFFIKVAGLWPVTLLKKETLAQAFLCEFCEISKNNFSTEHLQTTASDVLKGTEYASAECKVNCLTTFYYILWHILCLKSHVYFVISVQLDFHSKPCTCTVTFMEMNILRTLQRLVATTKRFSGKQNFVKSRKTLYR